MHSELSEIENNKDILSQKTRKDLSNLKQLFVTNQIFLKESQCPVLDKKTRPKVYRCDRVSIEMLSVLVFCYVFCKSAESLL